MKYLEEWYKQISIYDRLKYKSAKELYIKYCNTNDDRLKKIYMDKLITGTLYVVYNYLKNNDVHIFISPSFDMNDIISSFNNVWIEMIYNGELLKYDSFTQIINSLLFINRVYEILCGQKIEISEVFELPAKKLTELIQEYIELKNNGTSFDYKDLIQKYFYPIFICSDKKYLEMLKLLDNIYSRLKSDEYENIELSGRKILNYLKILISIGQREELTDDMVDLNNVEDSVISRVDNSNMLQDMRKRLNDERQEDIICKRYGIYGDTYTYVELGKKYNITKDRVRQIEARALRRLRTPSDFTRKYKTV